MDPDDPDRPSLRGEFLEALQEAGEQPDGEHARLWEGSLLVILDLENRFSEALQSEQCSLFECKNRLRAIMRAMEKQIVSMLEEGSDLDFLQAEAFLGFLTEERVFQFYVEESGAVKPEEKPVLLSLIDKEAAQMAKRLVPMVVKRAEELETEANDDNDPPPDKPDLRIV